ncbi:acetoacetate decarboxylase family protein [Saccharothrix mutabilis subsp. mutabilis]|uniref:Acetoacetate decarboxylase family protein n=1 Tax=Saccharothrix mutabilis subsp. mutabilis TaxID=66855 RepID=A0ABP3EDH2_9PSEU
MSDQPWPPPPWDLRGEAVLTVWTVRRDAVPALPPDVRPITVAGRAVVVTAFVDYRPPSVLAYRELLAAVLVRRRARLGVTITHIWVDDACSMLGARALWSIPKQPADFSPGPGVPIARAREDVVARPRLPVAAAVSVWQHGKSTPMRAAARVGRTRLRWRFPAGGGLEWMTAATPRLHLAVANLRLRFGSS